MRVSTRSHARAAGFTLAEVAVTLVIVAISLTLVLQALSNAKLTAANTRNIKLSRDLGLLTMGQVEAGLLQEEIRDFYSGSYADEGYPDFFFEIALGDEIFDEQTDSYNDDRDSPFYNRNRDTDRSDDDEEQTDEELQEGVESVKIKVIFPSIGEYKNYLILEQSIPWKQVYGVDEEAEAEAGKTESNP